MLHLQEKLGVDGTQLDEGLEDKERKNLEIRVGHFVTYFHHSCEQCIEEQLNEQKVNFACGIKCFSSLSPITSQQA